MEGRKMVPFQRVLAALHRQSVDRIPYVEALFDVRVAASLVEAVLERFADWLTQVAEGLCALDFDFIWAFDVDILAGGTPEEVRREVRERITQMGHGYGYLLSSSNSITPYCKPENVVAMLEALREFGHYPLPM
ncbi:MAG: uroporphyrinogen decarboxylase family protein [Spirochaetota bacterium]